MADGGGSETMYRVRERRLNLGPSDLQVQEWGNGGITEAQLRGSCPAAEMYYVLGSEA